MNRLLALAMAVSIVPLLGSPSEALPVAPAESFAAVELVRDGCGPGYRMGRFGDCRPQRYRSRDYEIGGGRTLHFECPRGFRYSHRSGRCRPYRF
ncbi:GCG_CRPN prefix-to-repeats domain-containing protein [uncultured Enterovirga sp.]|uniref:GCG_CRPN prefix-to-repeats domain-containing protein n=1 Tax=uncultured Enterovirga sp. TaxID=2026352 RepID=UPI0035C9B5C1